MGGGVSKSVHGCWWQKMCVHGHLASTLALPPLLAPRSIPAVRQRLEVLRLHHYFIEDLPRKVRACVRVCVPARRRPATHNVCECVCVCLCIPMLPFQHAVRTPPCPAPSPPFHSRTPPLSADGRRAPGARCLLRPPVHTCVAAAAPPDARRGKRHQRPPQPGVCVNVCKCACVKMPSSQSGACAHGLSPGRSVWSRVVRLWASDWRFLRVWAQ